MANFSLLVPKNFLLLASFFTAICMVFFIHFTGVIQLALDLLFSRLVGRGLDLLRHGGIVG